MATASLNRVVAYVRRLTDYDTRNLTDCQLLDRFSTDQDEPAFAELVRRHGGMVLATCRRILRHEQDAEDAFQAAFLVLARKSGSIRERDSIAGWLYQVAHRLAVRAKIDSDRRVAHLSAFGASADRSSTCLSTDGGLDEELERLPDQYRSAIVLCYLEGRTQTEAARLLATTADAVNSRLKRARDLLRHRLARQGVILSTAALAAVVTETALSASTIQAITRSAVQFATAQGPVASVSTFAASLANGALHSMISAQLKVASILAFAFAVLTAGFLLTPPAAVGENPNPAADLRVLAALPDVPDKPDFNKKKPQGSCIILWMGGGPSQIDTFDPKPGKNALLKSIDTNVKGIQFTEKLPLLAKQANHLAIFRSMSHRDANHHGGTHLMRAGYAQNPGFNFPSLGCVLAKELGEDRPELPRYLIVGHAAVGPGFEPSFLGEQYAAIPVGVPPADGLPPVEAFEARAQGKGEAHRKAVAKAFDLGEETAELRDAYGRGTFGQGCLLARRLVERGVPVVEVVLSGWDGHVNAARVAADRAAYLDPGFATLVKDLHDRKKLDSTLIVWMGEFGRTPVINQGQGRDHWPTAFTTVLAGRGIKGGQAIGKTTNDGAAVDGFFVSPQEFLMTIYQSLGVDATKTNPTPNGLVAPLLERGYDPVKAALR